VPCSQDRGALPERAVALIGYEVLKVVAACHRNGVLHGDVKPANFVLKDKLHNPLYSSDINHLFTPWLIAIDFGCSQYLGSKRFTKRTGTPVYMAPEIFERDYQREADMWSVGIMLYQLFARRFPFWDTYEACRSARLEEVQVRVRSDTVGALCSRDESAVEGKWGWGLVVCGWRWTQAVECETMRGQMY
jgi:calcium-dependent protein kinase